MTRTTTSRADRRGVALLTALAVLFVLTAMGTAYLGYMSLEVDESRLLLLHERAQHAALAGVQAAVGQLQRALAEGAVNAIVTGDALDVRPSVYDFRDDAFVPDEEYAVRARVRVQDESARLDLNDAPTSALRAILGVNGEAARDIRARIVGADQDETASGPTGYLTDVDDLVTRGLLTPEQFGELDRSLVTVHAIVDMARPQAHLNLNAAPPKVLEAILDVTPEVAEQVAAARPFATIEDVAAAAGKAPETFNYVADTPGALPAALTFRSSCFRIKSNAVAKRGPRRAEAVVEAVVVFTPGEKPVFTYWSEMGRVDDDVLLQETARVPEPDTEPQPAGAETGATNL